MSARKGTTALRETTKKKRCKKVPSKEGDRIENRYGRLPCVLALCPEPSLKYVFDVSDTGGKENARSPYLWQYRPGHEESVSQALEDSFEVPNQVGLAEQISTMALSLEDFGKKYILTLKGQMTHKVELGRDAKGNLTRIDNVLNGIRNRLDTTRGKLESLYVQQEAAKAELGKPFPQEAELQTKSARLTELNIALNIGDKSQDEAPIVEEAKGKRTPTSLTAAEPVKGKMSRLEDAR